MERNYLDVMQDRERKIQESKIRMDKIRQLSWSRNCNPDTTMPNTLPDKKYKTKQEFIDNILIEK